MSCLLGFESALVIIRIVLMARSEMQQRGFHVSAWFVLTNERGFEDYGDDIVESVVFFFQKDVDVQAACFLRQAIKFRESQVRQVQCSRDDQSNFPISVLYSWRGTTECEEAGTMFIRRGTVGRLLV